MSSKNTGKSGRTEFVWRLALTQFKTWNIPFRRFGQNPPYFSNRLLEQIQQFLGHTKLETTELYAASTTAMIKESYQKALGR